MSQGQALQALFRGDETQEARVGGLLLAQAIAVFRKSVGGEH